MTYFSQLLRAGLCTALVATLALGCGDDGDSGGGDDDDTLDGSTGRDASTDSGGRDGATSDRDGATGERDGGTGNLDSGFSDAGVRGDLDAGPQSLDASSGRDSSTDAAALSNNEVLAVMKAVNDGEITLGNLAIMKSTTPAVDTFAKMMVDMHTAANARQAMLGTPATNPVESQLRTMVATVGSQLGMQTGASFDTMYLTSQVQMHQQTLDLIDILKTSATGMVRAELNKAETEVEDHLEEATSLLNAQRDGGLPGAGDAGVRQDGG